MEEGKTELQLLREKLKIDQDRLATATNPIERERLERSIKEATTKIQIYENR
jgi:hypothetical protein